MMTVSVHGMDVTLGFLQITLYLLEAQPRSFIRQSLGPLSVVNPAYIPPRPQHEVTHFQCHDFVISRKRKKNRGCECQGSGTVETSTAKKVSLISAQLDDDDVNFPSSHGPGFGEAARQQISSSPVIFHVRIVIIVEIHEAENAVLKGNARSTIWTQNVKWMLFRLGIKISQGKVRHAR
jgi:hypothetical protein